MLNSEMASVKRMLVALQAEALQAEETNAALAMLNAETETAAGRSRGQTSQDLEQMLAGAQPTQTPETTAHERGLRPGGVARKQPPARAGQTSRPRSAGAVVEDEVLMVTSKDPHNDKEEVTLLHAKPRPRLGRSPVSAPGAIEKAPAPAPAPLSFFGAAIVADVTKMTKSAPKRRGSAPNKKKKKKKKWSKLKADVAGKDCAFP